MSAPNLGHQKEQSGNPAILLVSTNENLKMALQKSLLGMNYDLLTAASEGSAINLATSRKPAIVLVEREKHSWQSLPQHQPMQHIPMVPVVTETAPSPLQ